MGFQLPPCLPHACALQPLVYHSLWFSSLNLATSFLPALFKCIVILRTDETSSFGGKNNRVVLLEAISMKVWVPVLTPLLGQFYPILLTSVFLTMTGRLITLSPCFHLFSPTQHCFLRILSEPKAEGVTGVEE